MNYSPKIEAKPRKYGRREFVIYVRRTKRHRRWASCQVGIKVVQKISSIRLRRNLRDCRHFRVAFLAAFQADEIYGESAVGRLSMIDKLLWEPHQPRTLLLLFGDNLQDDLSITEMFPWATSRNVTKAERETSKSKFLMSIKLNDEVISDLRMQTE